MKAIILAAGYAIRLHPITKDKPKPLLVIAGRPIIEHILLRIEELNKVDEIFIVTNNRFYSKFEEWLKSFKINKKINIINDLTNSNEDRLGAIGDIDFVIKKKHINDDLLVIAGDNLFEFSLSHLVNFFDNKKKSTVALFDIKDRAIAAKKYGIVEVDNDLKIIGFEEKPAEPKTTLISTACYIFTKHDIQMLERCINENNKPDNLGDFIKWLSYKEDIFGYIFSEKWFDIGDHNQLNEADIHWSRK